MPNVTGFAALVDFQERHPDIPVVMMSGDDDPALVREAFDCGALGFIPKSSTTPVILSALRLVLSGGTYLPREIMAAHPAPDETAHASKRESSGSATGPDLTPRQANGLGLGLPGQAKKGLWRRPGPGGSNGKNHVGAAV